MIKENVANQADFAVIELIVTCTICSEIIQNPVQCTQCENLFCKKCSEQWNKKSSCCPFRCENSKMRESIMAKALLSKILFCCPNKCGYNIPFFEYEEHCESICPKLNYKEKYETLLIEYNLLKDEIDRMNGVSAKMNTKTFQYKSNTHCHHLCLCFTFRGSWKCSRCEVVYPKNVATFYCSVCDYDLCKKCFEGYVSLNSSI